MTEISRNVSILIPKLFFNTQLIPKLLKIEVLHLQTIIPFDGLTVLVLKCKTFISKKFRN